MLFAERESMPFRSRGRSVTELQKNAKKRSTEDFGTDPKVGGLERDLSQLFARV